MPDEIQLLPIGRVAHAFGCSTRSIDRYLRRDPAFPKPIKASDASSRRLWLKSEIDRYIAARARAGMSAAGLSAGS